MSVEAESKTIIHNVNNNQLCEVWMEDLMKEHHLVINDKCPVCSILVGRHKHATSSSSNSNSKSNNYDSDKSNKRDGTKSVIPKWSDYKHVKPFLDRIERVLEADLVDEIHWPRLLMKATDGYDSTWIKRNIVDAKLDWKEPREKFDSHFGTLSYQLDLSDEYNKIQQENNEPTQKYADKFVQLIEQLGYESDNEQTIAYFIERLSLKNKREFRKHMATLELSIDTSNIMKSLDNVIEIAIKLDAINRNFSANLPNNHPSNKGNNNNNNNNNRNGSNSHNHRFGYRKSEYVKTCRNHPHSTNHTTAECSITKSQLANNSNNAVNHIQPNHNDSGSKTNPPNDRINNSLPKPMKCYSCGGRDHYTNHPSCPRASDRQTRSQSQSSNNNNISPNSAANPINSIKTNSAVVVPTAPTKVFARAISVDGRDNNSEEDDNKFIDNNTAANDVTLGAISTKPLDRTLPDTVVTSDILQVMLLLNGYVYNTLIDTGACISFVDSQLLNESRVTIGPSRCGRIILANGQSAPNIGSSCLDATVLFPGCKRQALNISHNFELLAINGNGRDYHFIIGRDLIPTIFPDNIPSSYIRNAYSLSSGNVNSITITDLQATTDNENNSQSSVFTPNNLESEYAPNRQILLNKLAPLLQENASISGFCN